MKFTNPRTGNIVEGTPEEVARYHKIMTRKKYATSQPMPEPAVNKKPTYHRQRYSSAERNLIITMSTQGKKASTIANKLYAMNLCKFKRTARAITVEMRRMLNDPNRR